MLAAVAFTLGMISFVAAPLASLAADYPSARAFVHRHSHGGILVHGQATIVLLAFLWLGVVGLI